MARAALIAAVIAAGATATATAAPPQIHAHRGGTVVNGKPTFSEESLDAYRSAAKNGFVFEVDAKLTRDGVPVAIHDATLDRTTTCTGQVRSFTRNALRACRPDVLGSPGGGLKTRTVTPRGSIATIAEVLELARLTGSSVNLEIKNLPTDPDYDATPGYANRVMNVVLASGLSALATTDPELHPGEPRRGQAAHAARAHQPADAGRRPHRDRPRPRQRLHLALAAVALHR